MNILIFFLSYLYLVQSFIPSFQKNRKTNLFSDNRDLFQKFEEYSKDGNGEMQEVYLFKIYKYLSVKRDLENYENSLLQENVEDQQKFLNKIHFYIHSKMAKKQ